ncbi:MAG: hypothetical protein ACIAXF_17490 [Phycisphaerales bacterium JB063]
MTTQETRDLHTALMAIATKSAPLLLPFIVVLSTVGGLWSRHGSTFGLANVGLAVFASLLPALIGFVTGTALCLADWSIPKLRVFWFYLFLLLCAITVWLGYILGQALDF